MHYGISFQEDPFRTTVTLAGAKASISQALTEGKFLLTVGEKISGREVTPREIGYSAFGHEARSLTDDDLRVLTLLCQTVELFLGDSRTAGIAQAYDKEPIKQMRWSLTPPRGISFTEHKLSFVDRFIVASNFFQAEVGVYPTLIIAGTEVASVLESLPGFCPATPFSIVERGTLNGRWTVLVTESIPAAAFIVTTDLKEDARTVIGNVYV